MVQSKQIIRAFFVFIFIYGLLMAPWPGLQTAYSKFYRTCSAFLFEPFGSRVYVSFHLTNDTDHDIEIVFYNSDRQPFRAVALTSRHSGYIYLAFIISLILATPVSWKRKGLALFWGMIVMHCFLTIKMAILILFVFSDAQYLQAEWDPFWKRTLFLAQEAFLNNVVFCLIISVFIWLVVTFRREDLLTILPQMKLKGRKL